MTETERLRAVVAGPGIRLVTLTGTGGIGKTRLAMQAAAGLPDAFPDGLWWVGLSQASRSEHVLGVLAQVLGVREEEGSGLERVLLARLEGRRMLIVLDNAEHLLPDITDVVVRLLAASDRLVVLATSRERLQLSAEHVYPVPPLSAGEAAALLCERAAAAGVVLERSEVLDRLCERLDGCRWRWNWRLRGYACFPPRSCWTGSSRGSTCSRARGTPNPGTGRCAGQSSGAMTCSLSPSRHCSGGWRCSPAAGRWTPPSGCASRTRRAGRIAG